MKYFFLVLKKLREVRLYTKLEKCEFHTQKVTFLPFKIKLYAVQIKKFRNNILNNWSKSETVEDVKIFLGIANLY